MTTDDEPEQRDGWFVTKRDGSRSYFGGVAAVVALVNVLAGCGLATNDAKGEVNRDSVPSNVTVQGFDLMPPPLPANLAGKAGLLAELVDFHDDDFSGSWYDASDETLHIGVVTSTGRVLLERNDLTDDTAVVEDAADRSLIDGQRLADRYVRRSAFVESIVGWSALPKVTASWCPSRATT